MILSWNFTVTVTDIKINLSHFALKNLWNYVVCTVARLRWRHEQTTSDYIKWLYFCKSGSILKKLTKIVIGTDDCLNKVKKVYKAVSKFKFLTELWQHQILTTCVIICDFITPSIEMMLSPNLLNLLLFTEHTCW